MLTGKSRKSILLLITTFFVFSILIFSSKPAFCAGGPGENPGVTGGYENSGEDGNIQNEIDNLKPGSQPKPKAPAKEEENREKKKKSPDSSKNKTKKETKNEAGKKNQKDKKSGDVKSKADRKKPGVSGSPKTVAQKKSSKKDSSNTVKNKPEVKKKESSSKLSNVSGSTKKNDKTAAKKEDKSSKAEANEETEDATPWELKDKKSSGSQPSFRKLPTLQNVKTTKKNPEKTVVKLDKKEGLIPGFHLRFNDKVFEFKDNPLAHLNGKIYVCASDPDFKKLFDEMGLTYSWFSYSGKLFIYLRKGSVNWNTNSTTATVGDSEVTVPTLPSKSFSTDYIPLDSLATLLSFQLCENGNEFEFRPTVHLASEFSKENKTLNILLLSATEIKYEAKYQANPPAIRLKVPRGAYERDIDRLFVEGVQVRVNSKVDPDNLYITAEFPPHWKGEVIPTSYKNEVVIRMKPNLMYQYGIKDETLKDFKLIKAGKQVYAQFGTSAPVQYFWSWDKDEGTLYIDIPFCSPSSNIQLQGFKSEMIKNMDMTTLQPEGINITRFRIDMKQGAAFMIGPPEKQKGHSFALLIGPADTIPHPTPLVGGYHILTICGGNDIIVIDPGHGGSDPGACNSQIGIKEKHITLDISKRMAAILSKRGWKVYLTRHTDSDVTYPGSPDADELQARADVANKCKASAFISIHCNASYSKKLRGSSYHWWKPQDKELTHALKGSLGSNIGTLNKGARKDQFYVLSHSRVPACLVETAFMSNPKDAKLLASPAYRQKIAERLAIALTRFLHQKNLARKEMKNGGSAEE